VLPSSSASRAHNSGDEYTATPREASPKPSIRRETSLWSPAVGGCTIAMVSFCMPHLRYQDSSSNSIGLRCRPTFLHYSRRLCSIGTNLLGHPDVWLENSAEEDLATGPATKGGGFHSLQELGFSLAGGPTGDEAVPGCDSQIRGLRSSVENPPFSHILRPYDRTGIHLGLGQGSVAGD
jgi:hypothetical protein